jgi:hypothetical protein
MPPTMPQAVCRCYVAMGVATPQVPCDAQGCDVRREGAAGAAARTDRRERRCSPPLAACRFGLCRRTRSRQCADCQRTRRTLQQWAFTAQAHSAGNLGFRLTWEKWQNAPAGVARVPVEYYKIQFSFSDTFSETDECFDEVCAALRCTSLHPCTAQRCAAGVLAHAHVRLLTAEGLACAVLRCRRGGHRCPRLVSACVQCMRMRVCSRIRAWVHRIASHRIAWDWTGSADWPRAARRRSRPTDSARVLPSRCRQCRRASQNSKIRNIRSKPLSGRNKPAQDPTERRQARRYARVWAWLCRRVRMCVCVGVGG